ncbi:MAG: alpha/beta hydrolase [Acidobacteria bacterium]|nr:alpha/beta hydrolase [Acidobacteriota bacterium]
MRAEEKDSRRRNVLLVVALLLMAPLGSRAEPEAHKRYKSGFVTTTDGVRIHYLEAGQGGPAILFLPGWTMPAWIWEHQLEHFSKTHRVVAMDPRSQGDSSQTSEGHYPAARARDIRAVIEQLKLAPVVLVGWSMGVGEAVAYVDQFGTNDLAALILVDGIAGSDFDPQLTPQMLGWANSFQLDRKKTTETFVREMYRRSQSEEYLKRVTEASLATPTNSAMALLLAYSATDLRPALARIDKPTLVLVARSPWLRFYEELHQRIPGSRLEVMEGVGHAVFADDPAAFNALLDTFLAGLHEPTATE